MHLIRKGTGYDRYDRGICEFERAVQDEKIHLTGNKRGNKVEFRIVPLIGIPIVGWTRASLVEEIAD